MAGWSMVVPHREVVRQNELISGVPHPALAAYVLTYTARDTVVDRPLRWRVGQVGAITVSLDLDSSERTIADAETDTAVPYPRHAVSGLRDRPMVLAERPGRSRVLTIGLTPAGAYALLGVPLSELANTAVAFTDLLGAPARRLIERLADTPDWTGRFRLLDEHLLAWLCGGPALARPVHGAWQLLAATSGRMRISTLAEEVGWTRQHLVSVFRRQIGLTPKTVARLARLHRAVSMLAGPSPRAWADIAYACGYADQAHLSREFRALTGSSPTDLVVKSKRGCGCPAGHCEPG